MEFVIEKNKEANNKEGIKKIIIKYIKFLESSYLKN
jgi:hypothetical protein